MILRMKPQIVNSETTTVFSWFQYVNQWFFVAFPSLSDDKHQLGQVYSAAFWAESLCDGIHFCGSQCYPKATVEKMPLVI